jgi:hypothetical protein
VSNHHSLVLVHRGAEHRHPWRPECRGPHCVWVGIPVRTTRSAQRQYRSHVAQQARRVTEPMPHDLTPVDRLPEALR